MLVDSVHTTIDYVAAYALAATAAGTLLLALGTFVMAYKTRTLARSSEATADAAEKELILLRAQTRDTSRQTEAAQAALSASVAPLIVDVPRYTLGPGPYERTTDPATKKVITKRVERDVSLIRWVCDESSCWMRIPVQNVGSGAARIEGAVLAGADVDTSVGPVRSLSPVVVPRDEVRDLMFQPENPQALERLLGLPGDLVVEISYTDVSGRQPMATVMYLRRVRRVGAISQSFLVREVLPAVDHRLTATPPLPLT